MVNVSNLLFSSLEKLSQPVGHPTAQYNHPEDRAIGKLPTELNGDKNCLCWVHQLLLWNNWPLMLKIVTLVGFKYSRHLWSPSHFLAKNLYCPYFHCTVPSAREAEGDCKYSNWGSWKSKSKGGSLCSSSLVCTACSLPKEELGEGDGSLPPDMKEKK